MGENEKGLEIWEGEAKLVLTAGCCRVLAISRTGQQEQGAIPEYLEQ